MTEHASDRVWSGIDIPKTIAGALAAVCAAVVGSFLGVAGTLIGAAVASIVGSVGTEIYARSIRKGHKKLETLTPPFVRAPAAVGTPRVAAANRNDSSSHTVPTRREIRWGRVALVAGALFVLAMGTLTTVELITGKSAATMIGGHNTPAKTTFGGLFGSGQQKAKPTPTPTPTPAATPTGTGTATTAPATGTTSPPAADTATPTTEPTTQAPATDPPTTAAPEQAPASGGQGGGSGTGAQDGSGTGTAQQ